MAAAAVRFLLTGRGYCLSEITVSSSCSKESSDEQVDGNRKECEWRFNNRSKNLYQELLKLLRQHPL